MAGFLSLRVASLASSSRQVQPLSAATDPDKCVGAGRQVEFDRVARTSTLGREQF
jgi:hypothetical protein